MQACFHSRYAELFFRCTPTTVEDTLHSQKRHIHVGSRQRPPSLFYKIPFSSKQSPCLPIFASAAPNQTQTTSFQPKIVRNPDGTYTRVLQFPATPADADPTSSSLVLSKDIPLNPTNKTWLRVFLPKENLLNKTDKKLPVIVYFHPGGFAFLNADSTMVHNFCSNMAAELGAVVVAVDYRLAPEHRLPAAYDDAVEALHFIKTSQESWLTDFADLSTCFLMGSSSGGNIIFNAGVTLCGQEKSSDLGKVKGLIFHHPAFFGSGRTESELRLGNDSLLAECEYTWDLALPAGADKDHVYCNPMVGRGPGMCEAIRKAGWPALVMGCYGDLLVDRQLEFAKMLEAQGVKTVGHFYEGFHCLELNDPSKAEQLCSVVSDFISSVSCS